MAYPSVISTLATPQPTDRLSSPSHSTLHQNENSAILEIERAVGFDSSVLGTVIGDLRNPLSNGGGHVQTANKGGTGQTTYGKGDVLVGQNSSTLTRLAVGTDGFGIVADSTTPLGVTWRQTPALNYQSFISSGIWAKPTGLSGNEITVIQAWGGGGGGGTITNATNGAGGGGGGGAFVEFTCRVSDLPTAASVIVASSVAAGAPGNPTIFGSIFTAFPAGGASNAGGNTTVGFAAGGGGGFASAGGGGSAAVTSGGNGGGLLGGGGSSVASGNGADSTQGGGGGGAGGNNASGGLGGSSYNGGGGGGGGTGAGGTAGNGGNSFNGGGGGGGGARTADAAAGTGGVSMYGGAGGAGGKAGNGSAGTAPGGGGGGAGGGSTTGGTGARGEVRIWVI